MSFLFSYQKIGSLVSGYAREVTSVPADICKILLNYYLSVFSFKWTLEKSEMENMMLTDYLHHSSSFEIQEIYFHCILHKKFSQSRCLSFYIDAFQIPKHIKCFVACYQLYCLQSNQNWKYTIKFKQRESGRCSSKKATIRLSDISTSFENLCCFVDILYIRYHRGPSYIRQIHMDETIHYQWNIEDADNDSSLFGGDIYGNWYLKYRTARKLGELDLVLLRLPTGIGEITFDYVVKIKCIGDNEMNTQFKCAKSQISYFKQNKEIRFIIHKNNATKWWTISIFIQIYVVNLKEIDTMKMMKRNKKAIE